MLKLLWTKFYEKVKPYLLPFAVGAGTVLGLLGAIFIRRGRCSNCPNFSELETSVDDIESRIDNSIDAAGRIESGNIEALGITQSLGDRNNESKDRLDSIKESNNGVIDELERAEEILLAGKDE